MSGPAKHSTEQALAAFWRKVDRPAGEAACWEWMGAVRPNGYGSLRVRGKHRGPHQFSFEIHHGPIPAGHDVCHHCDNRKCVRPDHLFAGTRAENMQDCAAKGRTTAQQHPETVRGARHGGARLTDDTVRAIRDQAASTPRRVLAARYGMSLAAIHDVVNRRTWRHVA